MPNPITLPTRDILLRLNPRLAQRFVAKIRLGDPAENECWTWRGDGTHRPALGARIADGGRLETHYASRIAYILNAGNLLAGACVLHRCDAPLCKSFASRSWECGDEWMDRRHAAEVRAMAPVIRRGPNVIPHRGLWEGWNLPAAYSAIYFGRLREYEANFRQHALEAAHAR